MAKILCVEDDNFIADIYLNALEKSGHQVDVIANGTEALERARQYVYDVILLDLMLPDTSGVEILESLRGKNGNGLNQTKIIITTNFDEPPEDRQRLESMADGYIIKADLTPTELVDIVNQITVQNDDGDQ